MFDYIQALNCRDNNLYSSVAIIVNASRSYRNNLLIGREDDGTTNRFLDHVIGKKPESTYQKPGCIVSQALYAVWLYANRNKFTDAEIFKKYIEIMGNISVIGAKGEKYLAEFLFVAKFAHRSISDPEIFDNFAEILYNLTSKKLVMTYIDEIKHKSRIEGKEEGREEERAIARKHMERLVQSALSPKNGKGISIKKVAEIFQISVHKVKQIQQALA